MEIRRFRETNYGTTKMGKVFNFSTGKFIKGSITRNGYIRIVLIKNRMSLPAHRMVAECWIPIPEELKNCPTLQIDHINCVRTDNRVCNLRWASALTNRHNPKTYEKLCKPVAAYYKDGTLYKKYPSMAETQKDGFCRNCVYKAINKVGRMKYHRGFEWRYI